MCGRYVTPSEAAIERAYSLTSAQAETALRRALEELLAEPRYNVSPTQDVPILRMVRDAAGQRELVAMRWGLIPSWARGEPPKYSTINARAEGVDSTATYRGPWKKNQRCLFPAAGFYEWRRLASGSKQPWFIRPHAEDELFSLAGVWERSLTPEGVEILSCAILTTTANRTMAAIHERMPVIIAPEDVDRWLRGTPDEAKALLKPYPDERMVAYPVSTRVNRPANQGPDLIRAVAE